MNINRNSYEEILIDYMEGKLSLDEEREVLLFLIANPDIKEEFESLQNDTITIPTSDNVTFPYKNALIKKQVGSEYVDEFSWLCVAQLEGDASLPELTHLQQLIKETPSLKREYDLFYKAKLSPSIQVIYDRKDLLTRHSVGFRHTLGRFAVAASVAAIMVIISLPLGNSDITNQQASIRSTKPMDVVEILASNSLKEQVTSSTNTAVIAKRLQADSEPSVLASEIHQELQKRDSLPLLASVNSVNPSVVQSDNKIVFRSAATDSALIRTMNPAENPSRYLTVGEFLAEKIVGTSNIEPNYHSSSSKAKFWQIAQVGIKGVSRVLGIPVKIEKEYDKEGNLKRISFDSKLLALSREF